MELQTCIETRRSVRRFLDTPVSRDAIIELVRAANLAPSWKNSQVTRFYAADGDNKQALEACLPDFNRSSVQNAPVLLVAAVETGVSGFRQDGVPATHIGDGFQYFDCGLQVENLCLKARELGLGTLIMGLYDAAAVRDFFHLSSAQTPVCLIALGYPAVDLKAPSRLPVETLLTFKD